jgi:hypothetical protein
MNRNDFTGFISGNRVAGESDISGVRELTALFPWFHSAHLVLLRSLKESSDVKFETQLHRSAMFVADREALYNYLYLSSSAIVEEKIEPESPVITGEVSSVTDMETETVMVIPEREPEPEPQPEPELQPHSQPESEPHPEPQFQPPSEPQAAQPAIIDNIDFSTRSREELIAEIEARLKDLAAEPAVVKSAEVITSSPEMAENTVEVEATKPENEIAASEDENEIAASEDENEIQEEDESLAVLELDIANAEVGFSVQEAAGERENVTEDLLELEDEGIHVDEENEYQIQDSKSSSAEEQEKPTQADLIEKFIQTSPRLERMKPGNEPPVIDLSEPSTEVKGAFITETLARIYLSQGYYSKAINIYEKLTLQYPEKSAYFASRIEKIKDLIK